MKNPLSKMLGAVLRTDPYAEDEKRKADQSAAEAQAFDASAYSHMPSDLRETAKRWGVEAVMNLVWMRAFECGYKQATNDRAIVDAANGIVALGEAPLANPVPIQPSDAMIEAGEEEIASRRAHGCRIYAADIWNAMAAAAPEKGEGE